METANPGECVVVLVDDDPDLLEMVDALLGMGQCKTVQASKGGEALGVLLAAQSAGRKPCLMLLDLMLPDERGEDVYARLRSAGQQLPVVIMSAAADGALRAARIGAPFLPKPFDMEQLVGTVQSYCPMASL